MKLIINKKTGEPFPVYQPPTHTNETEEEKMKQRVRKMEQLLVRWCRPDAL